MTQSLAQSLSSTPPVRILDEWQAELPEDLYIPPAAFAILLDQFEGPLDFLIYLIQKNGFDLVHMDIAPIATQYLAYMDSMKSLNIELTADYMVMAALLADIKSRLLLPKPEHLSIEKDPKQQLIDRLEIYLRIKQAAERLGQMPVLDRNIFIAQVSSPQVIAQDGVYDPNLLKEALFLLFNRPEPIQHVVVQEEVQLEERIAYIEQCVLSGEVLQFQQLLHPRQGKMGLVVTFMAILELTRQQKINIVATGIDHPLAIQGVIT